MSEENKAFELTDEQLEQVSGGIEISSVRELAGLTVGQIGSEIVLNGISYIMRGVIPGPLYYYQNDAGDKIFVRG